MTTASAQEPTTKPESGEFVPPPTIGRYMVLKRLGAGGMGVVYLGYDPPLQRRVALKFIRVQDGSVDERAFVEEAKACAQLADGHVVTVYDVGLGQGLLFMAMELMSGPSMRALVQDPPGDWVSLLDKMCSAARGLASIHAKGLVHRDIKPDNILSTDEGRVCISDFGLALHSGQSSPSSTENTESGTPAYMAPELFAGQAPSFASDQYSFCISLYELLHGVRPFASENLGRGLRADEGLSQCRGYGRVRLPAWLCKILARGLAAEPNRRFPAMGDLLAALESGDRQTKYRQLTALAVALWLCCVTYVSYIWPSGPAECETALHRVHTMWHPARRERIRKAFAQSSLVFAEDVGARALHRLDRSFTAWRETKAEVCEQRTSLTHRVYDRIVGCLEQRLTQLDTLAELFEQPGDALIESSVSSVQGLASAESCYEDKASEGVLQQVPAGPKRERLRRLLLRLEQAETFVVAGENQQALTVAEAVLAEAETLGSVGLIAESERMLGIAATGQGQYSQSIAHLERTIWAAEAANLSWTAADALNHLLFIRSYHLMQGSDIESMSGHADAMIMRAGDPVELRLRWLDVNASAQRGIQGVPATLEFQRSALTLAEAELGRKHPQVTMLINNLSVGTQRAGLYRESLDFALEARRLFTQSLGEIHPHVLLSTTNVALAQLNVGDYAEALSELQAALRLLDQLHLRRSARALHTLTTAPKIYAALGDRERALASHNETLALFEALGINTVYAHVIRALAATLHVQLGQADTARGMLNENLRALAQLSPNSANGEGYGVFLSTATLASYLGECNVTDELLTRLATRSAPTPRLRASTLAQMASVAARCSTHRGQPHQALREAKTAREAAALVWGAQNPRVLPWRRAVVEAQLAIADFDSARRELEAIEKVMRSTFPPQHAQQRWPAVLRGRIERAMGGPGSAMIDAAPNPT